jgi:hypothetical protein
MFILSLVLMPILALLFAAYSDMHTGMIGRLSNALRPIDFPNGTRRHVRWSTPQELPVLLRRFGNVILVDLRSERGLKPSLHSGSHVLPTSPEHLNDLLPWLPPETGVLLCGPPDLCKALLCELRNSPSQPKKLKQGSAFVGICVVCETDDRGIPSTNGLGHKKAQVGSSEGRLHLSRRQPEINESDRVKAIISQVWRTRSHRRLRTRRGESG